METKQFDLKKH